MTNRLKRLILEGSASPRLVVNGEGKPISESKKDGRETAERVKAENKDQAKGLIRSLGANSAAKANDAELDADADDLDEEEKLAEQMDRDLAARDIREKQQDEVVAQLLACFQRVKSLRKGHREEVYTLYSDLYRASIPLARDAYGVRQFVLHTAAPAPPMPEGHHGIDWIIFAVRYAYWGRNKTRQKEASKYALLTEFLLSQRISPDGVLPLLKKYKIKRLLEMGRHRRDQESAIDLLNEGDQLSELPSLDQADVAEEFKYVGGTTAFGVEVITPEGVVEANLQTIHVDDGLAGCAEDRESPPETVRDKRSFPISCLKIEFDREQMLALRSLEPGEPAILQVRADKQPAVLRCVLVDISEA